MSKIICEVCGTSYPETSAQCPICGSVHPGDVLSVSGAGEEHDVSGEYTYVKGGRFSKSNVRKRNKGVQVATAPAPKKKASQPQEPVMDQEEPEQKHTQSNKGLIITIIILLLAIVAVLGYIVVNFLLPALQEPTEPSEDDLVAEEYLVACTDILVDASQLTFTEAGQSVQLQVSVLPAETTDTVSYTSADTTVATVDSNGLVTAVNRGETVITVTCGTAKAQCAVRCDIIPPEALEFRLNRQQITFDTAGAGWLLYSGDISVDDIIWTSDDETIVTIEDGRLTAVGEGYTCVYGEYLGNKQSCEVICSFGEDENAGHEGNSGVTEDGSQSGESSDNTTGSSGQYRLDNLYSSYDTEVTISVGEWFPLRLVDENGDTVDASWSVQNGNVCKVSGGDVTALASGETYVIATYNGQEYRCLVRVN